VAQEDGPALAAREECLDGWERKGRLVRRAHLVRRALLVRKGSVDPRASVGPRARPDRQARALQPKSEVPAR
jgi:hypothetical protein